MPNSHCLEYSGTLDDKGYGARLTRDGRYLRPHQHAWETINGRIPDGMCVLHSCDTRLCINPDHLFLGTRADNMRDMAAKGRAHSKLTKSKVRRIRKMYANGRLSQSRLAVVFGISQGQISNVVRRNDWWWL